MLVLLNFFLVFGSFWFSIRGVYKLFWLQRNKLFGQEVAHFAYSLLEPTAKPLLEGNA